MPTHKHGQRPIFDPSLCYVKLTIYIPREENLDGATPENLPSPTEVVIKEEDHLSQDNPQS